MTSSDPLYIQAPTTETLIKQSRRLLRSLEATQADLKHFVSLIEHQAHDHTGDDDDERERPGSQG